MSSAQVSNHTLATNGHHTPQGDTVDFSGKGLKLDTEADALPIINAIQASKQLTTLILEGNTLGVDAAKAISKALESQPHFQRALWKDAFTGRLKDEIPRALRFLGGGLILAHAKLAELDLSDNALGPVGMEGLVEFLKSEVCYSLKCLRLNNNGLGIYGGRMLAQALKDCLEASKKAGTPLALQTFIVGRNRLENEGAIALSEFFKAVGTLEEVQMPQNFIRHPGISALASALVHNPGLRVLNLNDNTFTWRGSHAVAQALPQLQKLSILNFGDCLIRTKGAEFLAKALSAGHENLTEVYMDHGEINLSGAKQLVNALKNKKFLKICDLNGNQFGEEGCEELREMFGSKGVLQSLSDDEGEPSEEEEESDEEEEEESDEEKEEEEEKTEVKPESAFDAMQQIDATLAQLGTKEIIASTVESFLAAPTLARFSGLGDEKAALFLKHIETLAATKSGDAILELYAEVVMKVSSVVNLRSEKTALEIVQPCVSTLLKAACERAQSSGQLTIFENILLVYAGLLKSEDKSFKPSWPLSGFFLALEHILGQGFLPPTTLETLKTFFSQAHPTFALYKEETDRLKRVLVKP